MRGREGKGREKGDMEKRGSILRGETRDNLRKKKDGEVRSSTRIHILYCEGDGTMLKGSRMDSEDINGK